LIRLLSNQQLEHTEETREKKRSNHSIWKVEELKKFEEVPEEVYLKTLKQSWNIGKVKTGCYFGGKWVSTSFPWRRQGCQEKKSGVCTSPVSSWFSLTLSRVIVSRRNVDGLSLQQINSTTKWRIILSTSSCHSWPHFSIYSHDAIHSRNADKTTSVAAVSYFYASPRFSSIDLLDCFYK
jgi:hypothetical protein